jgi:hypothetical protein
MSTDMELFGLRGDLFGDAHPAPGRLPVMLLEAPAAPAEATKEAEPPSAPLLLLPLLPADPAEEASASPAARPKPRALPEPVADPAPVALRATPRAVPAPAPEPLAPPEAPETRARQPISIAPVVSLEPLKAPPAEAARDTVVPGRRDAGARRRRGIAGWVVALVAVSASVAVIALRRGADQPTDPAASAARTAEAAPPHTPRSEPAPSPTPEPAEKQAARDDRAASEPTPAAKPPGKPAEAPAARPPEPSPPAGERPADAKPSPAPPPFAPPPVAPPPTAAPPPTVAEPPPAAAPPAGGGGEFNVAAARLSLQMVAAQAAGCKQAEDGPGGAKVAVTFAPSGRATSAQVVSGPFQATKTGACIAVTFRRATVPPFEGDPVVVTKDVSIR